MVNEISNKTVLIQNKQTDNDVNIQPVNLENAKPTFIGKEKNKSILLESQISIAADTVSRLNTAVQSIERDLQFQVDESSGDTVITVLDAKTDEVIRQIPTEEVLAVRENIETLKGILFSAKV